MKFDFTKNRNVDDMAKVPANCKAFYEKDAEEDGGFNLRTDEQTTAAVAVITGQNIALGKVREEVNVAKKAAAVDLTPLAEYGDTVEAISTSVKSKVDELTNAASGKDSDTATRIAAVKKEHGEAIAALKATTDGVIKTKQAELENYMIETSIMHAGAGWDGLNTKLIAPFARQQMQVQEVDGKPRVVVVGADKEARYSTTPERAGELMQTDELFVEMSEGKDYRQIFPSQQATNGGGAEGTRTPVGVRRTDSTKNMTPAQKISHGIKNAKKK